MTKGRHELLSVLDLLAGNLPAEEGVALRRRLAEDESLRELWRCVSMAWHESPDPGAAAVVHVRSAEQIGALLEGRLSAVASKAIGEECRHDAALVEEIVAAYRLRNLKSREEQAPGRLTQRLMALRASTPGTVEPASSVSRPENWAFAESPSPAREPADRRPPRVSTRVGQRGGRLSNRSAVRSRRAVIAVAAAMVVLGVSLLAAWQFGLSRRSDPNEGLTRDSGSRGATPGEHQINDRGTDRPRDPIQTPSPDRGVVRNDVSPPPTPHDTPSAPPPNASESPASHTPIAVVDVQWDQIIGLVAVADPGTDEWLGAQASRAAGSSITLASLPGSWAAGRIAAIGEIVLDADTRITWSATARPDGPPRIDIDRGRCALRGLSSGTTFFMGSNGDEMFLRVEEAGTLVVLDQTSGTRQVAVLSGGVDIGGSIVRRRQFVAWTGGVWSAPRTLDNPPAFVAGPESAAPIDSAAQQSLLASADLLSSLSSLEESASPQSRQAAVGWRLSLAPQATILASLRSSNESTRTAAVAWLMEDRPFDPSQALAWQTFAQELNDPQLARDLRRWMQLATSGRSPARSDLGDLLAGLDHSELGVRQFAQTCLERISGRRAPAYRADSSAAERQAGIRQWRGIIIRSPSGRRGGSRQSPSR